MLRASAGLLALWGPVQDADWYEAYDQLEFFKGTDTIAPGCFGVFITNVNVLIHACGAGGCSSHSNQWRPTIYVSKAIFRIDAARLSSANAGSNHASARGRNVEVRAGVVAQHESLTSRLGVEGSLGWRLLLLKVL